MTVVDAILIGLAGWRVAVLITVEAGPWAVFEKLRDRMGVAGLIEPGSRAQLFSCVACMSVWCVAAMALLWWFAPLAVMVVAAMGVTLLAERVRE